MRLTLCTLFNMNYHFLNTYYYCVHFSNYIVLFFFVTFAHGRRCAHLECAHVHPRGHMPHVLVMGVF